MQTLYRQLFMRLHFVYRVVPLEDIVCSPCKILKQAWYYLARLCYLCNVKGYPRECPVGFANSKKQGMQRIILGELDIRTARLMASVIHGSVKSCEILYPDPFP